MYQNQSVAHAKNIQFFRYVWLNELTLSVKLRLMKKETSTSDWTACDADDNVAPVEYLTDMLFSKIEVLKSKK